MGTDTVYPVPALTSLYTAAVHHTTPAKVRSRFFTVNFTAEADNFFHGGPGILDTGSDISIVPMSQLNSDAVKMLKKFERPRDISGVGGKVSIVGFFDARVQLGELDLPTVRFMVVDANFPCLLGLDVIEHDLVDEFAVSFRQKVVKFHLKSGSTKLVKYFKNGDDLVLLQNGLCPQTEYPQPQLPTGDLGTKKDTGLCLETGSTHSVTKKDKGLCLKTECLSGTKKDSIPADLKQKLELLATKFEVKLDHDNLVELEKMADCLLKNADVFGDDENMGTLIGEYATLPTVGEAINIPPRSYNPVKSKVLDAEVQRLKKMGIITKCPDNKGWNSPPHLVPKDEGKWRVTVDFSRSLNKRLTQLDPYPQPSIESVLNKIKPSAKFFSNVDLLHGYWQIQLDPIDQYKTSFFWNEEFWMFQRLPMGLTSAGNIFSRLVGKALGGADLDKSILKYLDDLCVVSDDFDSHLASIDSLFSTLRSKGLKIKGKKCQFLATGSKSVKFLGRCVGPQGIKPDPDYTRGVDNLAAPTTKKELEKLTGTLVWVKSFLSTKLGEEVSKTNFSQLMDPIFKVKREKEFLWTDSAQKALDKLKVRLKSQPVIGYADFDLPFLLCTDASAEAAGACLMQKQGQKVVIIGHCSKLFNSTERRWSTIERELFAIKFAIETFEYFLSARPFVVQTDHKPLIWVDKTNFNGSDKLKRWQIELSKYSFCIEYIKGVDNKLADWLSRPGVKFDNQGQSAPEVAGKFCKLKGSDLLVYIPSWCCSNPQGRKLEELEVGDVFANLAQFSGENDRVSRGLSAFLCQPDPDSRSSQMTKFLDFADFQASDSACFLAIQALESPENRVKLFQKLATFDDNFAATLYRFRQSLSLDPGARLLRVKIDEKYKLVAPPATLPWLLREAHSTAHFGVLRTTEKLENFWWPGKNDDIQDFVRSCQACPRKKGRYGMRPIKNGAIEKGSKPFDVVYVDFIQMENVRGFKYCMTAQCGFSRWLEVYPVKSNTAHDTVKCLGRFIRKWGRTPGILSSDRGVHFTAKVVEKLCQDLGIKQKLHCAWRPESSGSIERAHRTLKSALYCAAFDNKNTWLDNLDEVQAALNSCRNQVTKVSPFKCIFGREYELPRLPTVPDSVRGQPEPGVTLAKKLQNIHHAVKRLNQAADEIYVGKSTGKFDCSILRPGQEVLIFRENSVDSKNTHLPWKGPYKVITSNQLTAKLQDPVTLKEDYVSRHHIKPIVPRPAHLDDESEVDDDDFVETGGPVDFAKSFAEAVKFQPKSPLKLEPKSPLRSAQGPCPTPVKTSPTATKPTSPPAKSTPVATKSQPSDPLAEFFKKCRLKKVDQSKSLPSTSSASPSTRGAPSVPAPPLRRTSRSRTQTKQFNIKGHKSKAYD